MDLPKHVFFEGKIVPFEEAKVSVGTHALNYGTAVFGGIRGYWNNEKKKLYIFRPYDHYRRLLNSGRMMNMAIPYDEEGLIQLTLDLVRTEGWQTDIYIRPLIYKADLGIGVRLHNLKDELTIFSMPFEQYVKNDTNAHVTISSWRRLDDNMIPARGKVSGAYANSALIKTDAVLSGFDEALVLNQDGHISEGSAMNLFMVRDNVVITPPVTDNILEGITRKTAMDLAKNELSLPVVERSIDRTELFICDELFMTGSAAEIVAITRVDHRQVGRGEMGPVARQIREMFDDVVRAKNPKYAHWNVEV
jgi:branched-chain amino acid aminotransferase